MADLITPDPVVDGDAVSISTQGQQKLEENETDPSVVKLGVAYGKDLARTGTYVGAGGGSNIRLGDARIQLRDIS